MFKLLGLISSFDFRRLSSAGALIALGVIVLHIEPPSANAQKGKGAIPVITAIVDAGGYTPGIAQGSVFVVKGTTLSGSGYIAATAPTYPTTLNNVEISFTPVAGGSPVEALMVYTYNLDGINQLSAVLPSDTPVGAYDVRVANNASNSNPVRASVLARKPGIVSANGGGTGPAQATLAGASILQRYAEAAKIGAFDTRPARLGERVDLWLTGLGPDRASDTGGTSGDQTAAAEIRVILDGTTEIVPLYAGRSQGFPGLDQVVFNLPSNVVVDCFLSVQVRSGGVSSAPVTIATATGTTCVHPLLSGPTLQRLSAGQTMTGAYFKMSVNTREFQGGSSTTPVSNELVAGAVAPFAADLFNSQGSGGTRVFNPASVDLAASMPQGCRVFPRSGPYSGLEQSPPTLTNGLNAGTLRLNGPNGLKQLDGISFSYIGRFGTGREVTVLPGTYRLTGGGLAVGSFDVSLTLPPFEWSNRTSINSVNRSQPLTISWTGGGAGWVTVIGFAGQIAPFGTISNGTIDVTNFVCSVRASGGSLTVPTTILGQLPAATVNITSDSQSSQAQMPFGGISVIATGDGRNSSFTAPLTAGGSTDFGLFNYSRGHIKFMSYQ